MQSLEVVPNVVQKTAPALVVVDVGQASRYGLQGREQCGFGEEYAVVDSLRNALDVALPTLRRTTSSDRDALVKPRPKGSPGSPTEHETYTEEEPNALTSDEACHGSFRHPPPSCRHAIVVVQPAEHGNRRDRCGEAGSDVFARDRNPLTDPLVRPSRVEVAQGVFGEDMLQMCLSKDHDVIETFERPSRDAVWLSRSFVAYSLPANS
jgi:hypothetical protein